MSPSDALDHIHALVDGSVNIRSERLQAVLLRSIEELCRKGLRDATAEAIDGAANVVPLYPDVPRN